MLPRQRLLTTLRGGLPDRVPIMEFPFNPALYQAFLGYQPAAYNGRDAAALAMKIGLDGVVLFVSEAEGFQPRWLDTKRYRDEWGMLRQKDPAAWPLDASIGPAAEDLRQLADYTGPDPLAPGRTRSVEQALGVTRGQVALAVAIEGPFAMAHQLAGTERYMLALYDAPEIVDHLAQVLADFGIITGQRAVRAGADVLIIADDMGHKTGPFLSLAHFRRHILPHLRREVAVLKELGVPVLLHSDGDINTYLEDLVDAGFDGLNPLQRTANMDIARVKQLYGHRITLVGNVDASRTLPYGTADQVEQEVVDTIRIAAPGGRYVLSTDHSLHAGIPVPNVLTLIEAAHRWGRYPLDLTRPLKGTRNAC